MWVDAPGYGTLELERDVAIPLERAFPGARSLTTMDRVILTVEDKGELLAARQRASKAINAAQLPDGVTANLGPVTTEQDLIVRYAIRSPQRPVVELRSLQDWKVRPRLLQIPGIGDVSTCGGTVEQIEVVTEVARLTARGLSSKDLREALASSTGGYKSIDAIIAMPIRGGRIGDVAIVRRGAARSTCLVATARGADVVEGLVWLRTGSDRAGATTGTLATLAAIAKQLDVTITPLELIPVRVGFTEGEPDRTLAAVSRTLGDAPDEIVEYGQSDGGFATALADEFRLVVPGAVRAARMQHAAEITGTVLTGKTTTLRIAGPDLDTLARLARTVHGWARVPQKNLHPAIELDRSRAASLGISARDVALAVTTWRDGESVAVFYDRDRRLDVVLRVEAATLADVPVASDKDTVPLSVIATIRGTQMPRSISRVAGSRTVEIEVDGTLAKPPALSLPPGYTITIESQGTASGSASAR